MKKDKFEWMDSIWIQMYKETTEKHKNFDKILKLLKVRHPVNEYDKEQERFWNRAWYDSELKSMVFHAIDLNDIIFTSSFRDIVNKYIQNKTGVVNAYDEIVKYLDNPVWFLMSLLFPNKK